MKNNLLIDHTKLVIDQKLWDVLLGEVIFVGITIIGDLIECRKNDSVFSYYLNGKYEYHDEFPRLYLSNPFEQINEFPKLMEVSNDNLGWYKRIVICKSIKGNIALIDANVLTEINMTGDTCCWKYTREIQEPTITEYTLEEIAIKLGVNVNTIRIKK